MHGLIRREAAFLLDIQRHQKTQPLAQFQETDSLHRGQAMGPLPQGLPSPGFCDSQGRGDRPTCGEQASQELVRHTLLPGILQLFEWEFAATYA